MMKKAPLFQRSPTTTFKADQAAQELVSVCDFVRYAVSRFNEADLFFGHGTDNAFDEAVFLVLEGLKLPPDQLEPYWNARLTTPERHALGDLIHMRVSSRLPAPYLLGKAYLQGIPFYVDERVLIPRSFIAEILAKPEGFSQVDDYNAVENVLDLCTGSGCLAVLAASLFPNARIDAVDLSSDALDVAHRNVSDHGLEERITLYQGDLFTPLKGKKYDLILTNPPYVDQAGMDSLPPEYKHEPALALAAGEDGLDIVRRILSESPRHLKERGGLLCELGRCGPSLTSLFPEIPFLWVDTSTSSGEVFWLEEGQF